MIWHHYTIDGLKTICGKIIPSHAIEDTPDIDRVQEGLCNVCSSWVFKNRREKDPYTKRFSPTPPDTQPEEEP